MTRIIFTTFFLLIFMHVSAQEYFLLDDYNSGSSSTEYMIEIGTVGNKLVYSVFNDVDNENYYYATNGTVAGTELLLSSSTSFGAFYIGNLQTDDAVYFRALGNVYKYDGNELSTVVEGASVNWMTELNGDIYFIDETESFDKYLSKVTDDPTAPEIIFEISDPTMTGLTTYNGELYFFGEVGFSDVFLYKSDGTTAGTSQVYDLEVNANTNRNPLFTVQNGFLYFFYQQSFNVGNNIEREFYRTDGTTEGTQVIAPFMSETTFNDYDNIQVWSDGVFYGRGGNPDVQFDSGLWVSDGTPDGATFITDINNSATNADLQDFTAYNGLVYFTAKDTDNRRKIFRTDGTADGTFVILDDMFINDYGEDLTVYDGYLVFGGNAVGEGREVWFSDGTEAGTFAATTAVADGNDSFASNNFIPFGNNLMFRAFADGLGYEVYIYNNGQVTPTLTAQLSAVACNDNGTAVGIDDDYAEVTLDVSATGAAATYTVSSTAGTPVPATGTYGQQTTFTLPAGSAGGGDFTITVSDSENSSLTSQIAVSDPGVCSLTSTEQSEAGIDLSISPNPFQDYVEFRISDTGGAANYTVDIYSVTGQLIERAELSPDNSLIWRAEELKAGFYLYKIRTKSKQGILKSGTLVKMK